MANERSTWLKLLFIQLSNLEDKDIVEPIKELESSEPVLGQMSELAKKLWTLKWWAQKDGSQASVDAHFASSSEQRVELMAKARELEFKSQAIDEIMWVTIREDIGNWQDSLGVRSGFVVIKMQPPPFRVLEFGELP